MTYLHWISALRGVTHKANFEYIINGMNLIFIKNVKICWTIYIKFWYIWFFTDDGMTWKKNVLQGWINIGGRSGGRECTIFLLQKVIMIFYFQKTSDTKVFICHKCEFHAMKHTRPAVQNVIPIKLSYPRCLSHRAHFQVSHGLRSYLDFDL